jgi:hypothetical protein
MKNTCPKYAQKSLSFSSFTAIIGADINYQNMNKGL